jgi:membrane protease YdiL (CAAX protease family)
MLPIFTTELFYNEAPGSLLYLRDKNRQMTGNPLLRSPLIFFISRLLILMGMVIALSFVAVIVGSLLTWSLFGISMFTDPGALSNYDDPQAVQALKVIQLVWVAGAFMIPAWFFPKSFGQDSSTFLLLKKPRRPVNFLTGILLLVVSMPVVSWLVYVNQGIRLPASWAELEQSLRAMEESAEALTKVFMKLSAPSDIFLNLIVLAVMPAVAEELLFRGALLQLVRFSFGNVHLAVVVSAIIFSAFHGQFYGFIPRMFLGLILGYLFVYSGSILPGMLIHFLNNALALLITWNHWDENGYDVLKADYVFPGIVVAASIAATIALIYLMRRWHDPYDTGYAS